MNETVESDQVVKWSSGQAIKRLATRLFGRLSLCVLSSVLLIFSFPNFEFSFVAWFALIPFFFAVRGESDGGAFFLGFITGLIFYLGSMYWLIHVTTLGFILLSMYLALYFGIAGIFLRYIISDIRSAVLAASPIWVALEYLRSTILTGMGWSLLGYSQYKNLSIIQIADITGPYGISFLIVMTNVLAYQLLSGQLSRESKSLTNPAMRQVLISVLFIPIVLGYGYSKLNKSESGIPLKISVVQGNISQHQKWDENYTDFIFGRYYVLTKEAALDKPDLIIWPETSFPGYFGAEKELTDKMKTLVSEVKIPVLFGAPTNDHNSAFLIYKTGEVTQQYNKIHLVPFGEYVPLEKWLGFVHNIAPSPIGGFKAGTEYTIFSLPSATHSLKPKTRNLSTGFSVLVCFEDIFPQLVRQFVKQGAAFLVNITNDAWFEESSAPYQHAQASVFRAVENRVNVVRAANTGLSCFINPTGKIFSRVEDRSGKDIFVDGYDTADIIIEHKNSFYTKYGDIFAYLCIAISVIFLTKNNNQNE
ncbi:MAG: apolipoprotein N-acyltransferase [Candidatus Omnitrophica bacterium CG07_land_8_20_14_0_80_42_15]|uniref:Apolipoprotein N-acyltransferase n=1 Tax=Candidatus Aquitaenariimonas noxiae TaxID=1974741 RepID=A0A2J0L5L0_9BACT|nr:MAG: apolipoprotein N-acyltransferase [Candidatus Omnitrophica bacterium CG07_land_8_20_14_0_80_42_15]